MKNSKEYAGKLMKFFRSCKPAKVTMPKYSDPVEAMIFGLLSESMPEAKARSVYASMQENFVDWNDLRVSRLEEISEVLREETASAERITANLNQSLNFVFRAHDTISMAMLAELGKRPARKFLEGVPGLSRFVVDYIMLTSLDSHCIPLTQRMQEYLKNAGLADPEATEEELEGYLQRQISASNAYAFYVTLRKESERTAGEKLLAKKLVKTAHVRASTGIAKATHRQPEGKSTARKKHSKK